MISDYSDIDTSFILIKKTIKISLHIDYIQSVLAKKYCYSREIYFIAKSLCRKFRNWLKRLFQFRHFFL